MKTQSKWAQVINCSCWIYKRRIPRSRKMRAWRLVDGWSLWKELSLQVKFGRFRMITARLSYARAIWRRKRMLWRVAYRVWGLATVFKIFLRCVSSSCSCVKMIATSVIRQADSLRNDAVACVLSLKFERDETMTAFQCHKWGHCDTNARGNCPIVTKTVTNFDVTYGVRKV